MAPRLIVRLEPAPETVHELRPGANSIGRTPENTITLLHKSLSRSHAKIEVTGDRVFVEDLGSKNGTLVDGARITRMELGRAHTIRFGDVVAQYVASADIAPLPTEVAKPSVTRALADDFTRLSIADIIGAKRLSATALNLRVDAPSDRDHDKLRILLKVSQLLASPASLDVLLASVVDLAFEILDIDRVAILMVDRETGALEPRLVRGRRGTPIHHDEPFSRSVARYVCDHGVAALFADAKADHRLADAGSVHLQSIRTSMCAPLKSGHDVLGALYVDNLTKPNAFDEEDLDFLGAFGNQAAIAIENSLLNTRLAAEAVSKSRLLRFFPPAAANLILEEGSGRLGVLETTATVLFSDISGYTEMSARMRPVEVIALLNAYFPAMAEIVFRHGGTLEKYIGDALLAVWGAPIAYPDSPARAVRAAIEMQHAARALARGIGIHVGVNTGSVAAGNIGSDEYIQYATIGDATNVASRICGVAKRDEIVIDERTAAGLEGTAIELVPLGEVALRGKAAPTQVFRVEWDH